MSFSGIYDPVPPPDSDRGYLDSEIVQYVVHIALAVLLGLIAGTGGILFHYLLEESRTFFDPKNFSRILMVDPAFIIIIPVIGAVLAASMRRLFPVTAGDEGVLSVIKAIILKHGYIPVKNTLFHLIAPIVSIGTGAPLGPEGPAAKIGSGLGSFMAQLLNLNRNDMMMYTAAGAGAAISAVFNAPIAGVFFGIEVILQNDLKNRALSILIISSVVADVLSGTLMHEERIFSIPLFDTGEITSYYFYGALGLLSGLISVLYFKLKIFFGDFFNRLNIENDYLKLIPVSLIFGIFLLHYSQLFGVGYGLINDTVKGLLTINDLAVLLALKLVFLALFLKAGAYGGTFAPSLGIGALLGALFASLINLIPGQDLNVTACALVGMGGVLAGINSIPLTAIMLVFEITGDYKFILPLMLASIIAYLVTIYHNRGTVYAAELLKEGIDVTRRGELDLLGRISAGSLMRTDFDSVMYNAGFPEIIQKLTSSIYGTVFVVNSSGQMIGIISLGNVKQAMAGNDLVDLLIAGDLSEPVAAVTANSPVSTALEKIERYDLELIPVVKDSDPDVICGVIMHSDILLAYSSMLKQAGEAQELVKYSGRG
jgi:CIC family chloride channel protein